MYVRKCVCESLDIMCGGTEDRRVKRRKAHEGVLELCSKHRSQMTLLLKPPGSSAETNSTIFEYSIITVPFECLNTYTNYLGKYVIGPHVIHMFRNGEFKEVLHEV